MRFKAVIFDLDGTLLDTLDDLADSMNCVLSGRHYPIHEAGAYKYFVGNGLRDLVRRTFPEDARYDENVDRGLAELRDEYGKRWSSKTKPYKDIDALLSGLADTGMKMAVLSNKADDFTKQMIRKFLPDWHFSLVLGERSGVPRKPDPAGALEIASTLGIQPEDCLYLGDTGVDMKTAVSAGMYPVGVLWGFRKAEELVESGARLLITNPAVLLDLL
ncbi:MAG: HAD-IA family hydrolase [Clostridiaceae bacterium]